MDSSLDLLPKKTIKPNPGATTPRSIDVYCRVRPVGSTETISPYFNLDLDNSCVGLDAPDEILKRNQGVKKYFFTKLFGPCSSQEDVYTHIVKDLIYGLTSQSRNGLVFSYGVTNAGKTHTIVGKNDGILPRILQDLIELKQAIQTGETIAGLDTSIAGATSSTQQSYSPSDLELTLECFEIYNEDIYDLNTKDLPRRQTMGGATERPKLKIKDNNRKMVIEDIKVSTLHNLEQAFSTVEKCLHNRQVAATALNANSSRSHTVFKISASLIFRTKVSDESVASESEPNVHKSLGYLCVVDLAGSERMKRTETSTGDGKLKEACGINNSLLVLGRCLQALQKASKDGSFVVPFRDCKLTKFLAEFFQYSSTIKMITNINPRVDDFTESLRVLNYASIAKEVKLITSEFKTMRLEGQMMRASANKQGALGLKSAAFDADGDRIGEARDETETIARSYGASKRTIEGFGAPQAPLMSSSHMDDLFKRLEDRIQNIVSTTIKQEVSKVVQVTLTSSLLQSSLQRCTTSTRPNRFMSEPKLPYNGPKTSPNFKATNHGLEAFNNQQCSSGFSLQNWLKDALAQVSKPDTREIGTSPAHSNTERTGSSKHIEHRRAVNKRKLKGKDMAARRSVSEDTDSKKRAGKPYLRISKTANQTRSSVNHAMRSGPARSQCTSAEGEAESTGYMESSQSTPMTPEARIQPKRSSFYDTLMKEPKVKEHIALEISLKEHRRAQEDHLKFYLGVCDGNLEEAIKFFHQEYNVDPDEELLRSVAQSNHRTL